ncbi:BatD family protein [Planctobacterium marinum]|uniref:BatD family protein n=1 Tax=Planctobacterium marinum TaxID=1631968 RepID=UPI001E420E68|nr:BatD family protein [Planctobacterium marinum]MCC2604528.1 BatD family protein [Planctobacterium marinum]
MRVNISNPILCILCLVIFWANTALAAPTEASATVDKNPVMVEESFRLTVTVNDDVPGDEFDSSPLLQDFVVGRTSVSRQTQMINFDTTRSTVWTTTLMPRQAGQFTIPALRVAGLTTAPIQVQVVPVSNATQAQNRDIYITAEVEKASVFVQQQIKYTTRLHLAVDLQSGSLSQPELPGADIEQVGKDREFTDIINGKRYRIIERTFSIIPNSSGEYTIRGPLFDGEVIDNNRQSFGFFNRTRNVQRIAKDVDVEVLPIPEGYNEHWLPSEFVQLTEEWQTSDNEFRVGTPVTRTITLTAVGVTETQLPELDTLYPPSMKAYPDQAETARVQRNGTIVAQRTETVALIPNEEGTMIIPEVTLKWFNVVTKETEVARLPARSIEVLAPASAPQALPDSPKVNPVTPPATVTESPLAAIPMSNAWWSVSSWALLVLWLLTLLIWWLSARQRVTPVKTESTPLRVQKPYWQELQKELMRNKVDVNKVNGLLPGWLATLSGLNNVSVYTHLERLDNSQLKVAIDNFFKHYFGQSGQTSEKQVLKALLSEAQKVEKQQRQYRTKEKQQLASLYPTR